MTPRVAVIDVGSNSVRLLLLERLTADGAEGPRITTVTGLRRGAAADGSVAADALDRLDACLARYADDIRAAGAPAVVAVGTAAVREAPNVARIDSIVRHRLGVPLVIAEGRREAALAFAGARMALGADAGPCRMIDIGGASTEVVQGTGAGPAHLVSLPLGVVRNADMHPDEARAEARRLVGDATATFPVDGPVVGLAGTVTQAAAIVLGYYDPVAIHRMRLSTAQIEDALQRSASVDLAARTAIPGMHPDRADVIVNGLAILLGALAALGADEVIVSERDILDGIAADAHLVPPSRTE